MDDCATDVSATLLWAALPDFDVDDLMLRLSARAITHDLAATFRSVPQDRDDRHVIAGGNMSATLQLYDVPLREATFAPRLAALGDRPAAQGAAAAIAAHEFAVAVTIDSKDAPHDRQLLFLHLLLQGLAQFGAPLLIDFRAGGLLLGPADLEATQNQGLPYPFLIGLNPTKPKRGTYTCKIECTAQFMGHPLRLEAIPEAVPHGIVRQLAGSLIAEHLAGRLPLADGETITETGGLSLSIRRETTDGTEWVVAALQQQGTPAAKAPPQEAKVVPMRGKGARAKAPEAPVEAPAEEDALAPPAPRRKTAVVRRLSMVIILTLMVLGGVEFLSGPYSGPVFAALDMIAPLPDDQPLWAQLTEMIRSTSL